MDSRREGGCSAPTGVAQRRNAVNDASCVTTSYNATWPFQVVLGLGMGLTMPAVAAAGMAAVDSEQSGIASGVINASRQVGGALRIPVLGSIAPTITRRGGVRRPPPPARHRDQ